MYPCYHACLAARRLEKFGEVAPPSPKVIVAHTPNFKRNFEFWLSAKKFLWAPPFLSLSHKVPPTSHRLAKFGGDRPRGLRDFAPKPFTPHFLEGEAPKFETAKV